jgi:hypothetical protein
MLSPATATSVLGDPKMNDRNSADDIARRFTARGQTAGFIYQVRYALLVLARLARIDPGASLTVERLDDIEVGGNAGRDVRFQTKHHQDLAALTDRSPDLWKTIHVWADQVHADESLPDSTLFVLITTAIAGAGSVPSLLRESNRDIDAAQRLLDKISIGSPSDTNKDGYTAWGALSGPMRARLLAAMRINRWQ